MGRIRTSHHWRIWWGCHVITPLFWWCTFDNKGVITAQPFPQVSKWKFQENYLETLIICSEKILQSGAMRVGTNDKFPDPPRTLYFNYMRPHAYNIYISLPHTGDRLKDDEVESILKFTGTEEDLDGNIKYEGRMRQLAGPLKGFYIAHSKGHFFSTLQRPFYFR